MDGVLTRGAIGSRLGRDFFARRPEVVARALIGMVLAHDAPDGLAAGIVVETEAYDQDDPASHSFRGRTPRNGVMFGPPGIAYVYLSYGVHWCMNAVTGRAGRGSAVLIRALEPVGGIDAMSRRRGATSMARLCRGPGNLARALAIGRDQNGLDLVTGPIALYDPGRSARARFRRIAAGPRIGITKAVDRPWRFCAADSPALSRRIPADQPVGRHVASGPPQDLA